MKGRFCLANLISFYDEVTSLVDKGQTVNVAYLDFRESFNSISYRIILEKLAGYGLVRSTFCWVKRNS